MLRPELVQKEAILLDWIAHIHAQGIRRPSYPADQRAEQQL
ncbi:MAG: hypothetical protein ABSA52_09130 [Candidatus Binatia bacterium]|jgi:hypothetical protein